MSRRQLLDAGLTRNSLDHRVKTGRLHRLHRGVYAVGHLAPAPLVREMAAVLACGPDAALSHHAAAAVWGLRGASGGALDVTVAGREPRSRGGIRVHTVDRLDPRDLRRRHGIPLTAPARTLLDIAHHVRPHELQRAVDEAVVQRLATTSQLQEAIERAPARRGAAALRRILLAEVDPAITRSEAEDCMLELIRKAGLPKPRVNARTAGYVVDFLWQDQRVTVETDGFAYHGTRSAFERDRKRDVDLQARGFTVLRFTWRRLTEEPETVIAQLAAALALAAQAA